MEVRAERRAERQAGRDETEVAGMAGVPGVVASVKTGFQGWRHAVSGDLAVQESANWIPLEVEERLGELDRRLDLVPPGVREKTSEDSADSEGSGLA